MWRPIGVVMCLGVTSTRQCWKRLGLVSIYPPAAEKERQSHQGTAYGPLFGSEPVIVEDVSGSMMFASVRAQMDNPAEKKTAPASPFVYDSDFTMSETAPVSGRGLGTFA